MNRYTCKACGSIHDSEQDMYNLHLPVKDRANIYESLVERVRTSELLSDINVKNVAHLIKPVRYVLVEEITEGSSLQSRFEFTSTLL